MVRCIWVVVLVLAAPLLLPASAPARARPRAFTSCAGLVGYAERHFSETRGVPSRPVVTTGTVAPPLGRPVGGAPQETAPASAAPTTFSTTNNQEEGVDEPD